MPVPAMTQAIRAPATPVAWPNFEGNVKMPEPIIEPITSAMRENNDSFRSEESVMMIQKRRGTTLGAAWRLITANG